MGIKNNGRDNPMAVRKALAIIFIARREVGGGTAFI